MQSSGVQEVPKPPRLGTPAEWCKACLAGHLPAEETAATAAGHVQVKLPSDSTCRTPATATAKQGFSRPGSDWLLPLLRLHTCCTEIAAAWALATACSLQQLATFPQANNHSTALSALHVIQCAACDAVQQASQAINHSTALSAPHAATVRSSTCL